MSTVLCSHGFGVGADSRGMFTQIAAAFPEHTFVMFDYNQIDKSGDMVVRPLDEQAKILQRKRAEIKEDVILLCHSQGCMVAGLASLNNVSKVILLAPPSKMDVAKMLRLFGFREGSVVNRNGVSRLARSDGSYTLVPKEYFDFIDTVNPLSVYQKIGEKFESVILKAHDDEILGETNFDGTGIPVLIIDGDHNFSGKYRKGLLETLQSELAP